MNAGEASCDLFKWLPADVSDAVKRHMHRRRYEAGQTIYMQDSPGDEMLRVESGLVRLMVIRQNGRELLHSIFFPGDFFGESSLIDGGPRPHSAEAHTVVEMDVLGQSAFNRLREQYRVIDWALLKLMTSRMRSISSKLAQVNLDEMQSRVAMKILTASVDAGNSHSEDARSVLAFSQSDLALMVGASRQSVNKVLQDFQAREIVRVEYGKIHILKPRQLQNIANSFA